jgi:CRISPR-associated protein Cmr3
MNRYAFLVEPLESVFFGPPRSFSAGEAHRADSIFPPSPFTFQGLIRSQLLRSVDPPLDLDDWSASAREDRAQLVGGPDSLPAGWQLQGPFPARRVPADDPAGEEWVEPWVPTPRFVRRHQPRPVSVRPVVSTHLGFNDLEDDIAGEPFLLCGQPDLESEHELLGGWLGPSNLYAALAGADKWNARHYSPSLPPFVWQEQQPGLAIDPDTGTAHAGMLYFLSSLRFRYRTGLLGNLSGSLDDRLLPSALTASVGSAGRKGRLVSFTPAESFHPDWSRVMAGDYLPAEVTEEDTFWLVTLTPVRLPGAPVQFELRVTARDNARPRILAALTGRPVTLGGYQMATGQGRPNRLYVPAGSAWLIRIDGGTPESRAEVLRQLHNAHRMGDPNEAGFGCGHTVVGIAPRP